MSLHSVTVYRTCSLGRTGNDVILSNTMRPLSEIALSENERIVVATQQYIIHVIPLKIDNEGKISNATCRCTDRSTNEDTQFDIIRVPALQRISATFRSSSAIPQSPQIHFKINTNNVVMGNIEEMERIVEMINDESVWR